MTFIKIELASDCVHFLDYISVRKNVLCLVLFARQGMEVSTLIVKQKDLGCNASTVHIIDQGKETNDSKAKLFWKTLGGKVDVTGTNRYIFLVPLLLFLLSSLS